MTDDDYQKEREKAQMAVIAASMNRAFGRRPDTLPGRKAERQLMGGEQRKADHVYQVLRR